MVTCRAIIKNTFLFQIIILLEFHKFALCSQISIITWIIASKCFTVGRELLNITDLIIRQLSNHVHLLHHQAANHTNNNKNIHKLVIHINSSKNILPTQALHAILSWFLCFFNTTQLIDDVELLCKSIKQKNALQIYWKNSLSVIN